MIPSSIPVWEGRDFSSTPNYSNEVAAEIDAEIRNFVEQGYAKAEEILRTHIDQLHTIAQFLIKHEKIEAPEFEKLMSGQPLKESSETPEKAKTSEIPENPTSETSGTPEN